MLTRTRVTTMLQLWSTVKTDRWNRRQDRISRFGRAQRSLFHIVLEGQFVEEKISTSPRFWGGGSVYWTVISYKGGLSGTVWIFWQFAGGTDTVPIRYILKWNTQILQKVPFVLPQRRIFQVEIEVFFSDHFTGAETCNRHVADNGLDVPLKFSGGLVNSY